MAASPTHRSRLPGCASTTASARLAESGAAAKVSPSITSTRPNADRTSPSPDGMAPSGSRARGGRRGPRSRSLAQEIAEELPVRGTDIGRGVTRQGRRQRLHRPIEIEEARIAAIGGIVDGRRLGVPFAPQDLALLAGVGHDHDLLLVRLGLEGHSLLLPFGPDLAGLLLALGLHPAEDRLAVGGRQVDALDAHVDDLDPETLRVLVHPPRDLL